MNPQELNVLSKRLGHQFSDLSLLVQALTHRSSGKDNNERLEFLGDALLSFAISQILYLRFPDEKEGVLSGLRARLVRGNTLADLAREFSLSDYIIVSPGERKSGGQHRNSILADCMEAIIGAIFLDGGVDACQSFIQRVFDQRIENINVDEYLKDPKTRLQELLQARQLPLPNYSLVKTQGESHQQLFTVCCETSLLKESPQATASSLRKAEKLAAEKSIQLIRGEI